jgi:sarcosine oxidase
VGTDSADVVVVGLGAMGAAAAYQLAARGVRVLGVDQFVPPHGRGSHAGDSRIIRMAYMEGAEYVPLVRRAYELWRELESAYGQSLLTQTGGLMVGVPESHLVTGAVAAATMHGLAFEMLDCDQIRRTFPVFAPRDDEVGVYEEVAGVVRPERSVQAMLRSAEQAGVRLATGVAVRGWRASADAVTVLTDGGEIHAGRLVLAPGAWASTLAGVAIPLRVQRRVQHFWRLDAHIDAGASLEVGALPVWIWEHAPGQAAYGFPRIDGTVKTTFHDGDDPTDPATGPAPARPDEVDAMRAWLATHLPALAGATWAGAKPCLYTLTPDEHFILGPHPDHSTVVLACGFSGHGFKFAPVVGEIVADLVTTGHTAHHIGLFDPTRSW